MYSLLSNLTISMGMTLSSLHREVNPTMSDTSTVTMENFSASTGKFRRNFSATLKEEYTDTGI